MKVRMVSWVSGTRDGVDWPAPGGTIDVPADEAAVLLAEGLAEEVLGREAATVEPSETATVKKPRKREV